jgi:hypothetical protein
MKQSDVSHKSINAFDLIKWRLRGFNQKDAEKWIKSGFTLSEAILLKEKELDDYSESELESD